MVLVGVHQVDRAAIHRHQGESAPLVFRTDPAGKLFADALVDGLDEGEAQAAAGLAVTGCVRGGNRQIAAVAPALDQSDGLLTGGVGFKDLGEPCPEYRQMAEAALTLGRINGTEEIAGQEILEKNGVSAQRAAGNDRGGVPDRGLQPPLGSGKNGERKVGQERLFGHTS